MDKKVNDVSLEGFNATVGLDVLPLLDLLYRWPVLYYSKYCSTGFIAFGGEAYPYRSNERGFKSMFAYIVGGAAVFALCLLVAGLLRVIYRFKISLSLWSHLCEIVAEQQQIEVVNGSVFTARGRSILPRDTRHITGLRDVLRMRQDIGVVTVECLPASAVYILGWTDAQGHDDEERFHVMKSNYALLRNLESAIGRRAAFAFAEATRSLDKL